MLTHYIDATIIAAFIIACIMIGLLKARRVNTLIEFVEFNNIGVAALVCSLLSSSMGVGITFGISEKIYLFGFAFLVLLMLQPLCWIAALYFIAPGIERFRGCLTIGDIMHKSYGNTGRYITSILTIIYSIGVFSMQITAVGYLLAYFFNCPSIYGSIFGTFIFVVYSVFGGMRSVIYTEMFKVIIIGFIFPISCGVALTYGSDINQFMNNISKSYIEFKYSKDNILLLISFIIFSIIPSYNPDLVQRYLLAKDSKQLNRVFKFAFALTLFASLSIAAITYIVISTGYIGSSKEIFLFFITELLPVGLQGLMIAGLIAIFISKAESDISAASTIVVNDILKNISNKLNGKQQLAALRITIIFLSCISLIGLSYNKNLLDIILFVKNFWEPIILIPITCAFLGFRTNQSTFIANTIFALVFLIIGRIYAGKFATISFSFGMVGSLIGFFGSHYLQKCYGRISSSELQNPTIYNGAISCIKHLCHNFVCKLAKPISGKPKYGEFIAINMTITFVCMVSSTHFINPYLILGIAFISYTLVFMMIFRDHIPLIKNPKFFRSYWLLSLIFCFPFSAGCFMFFGKEHHFWVLSSVFITFALSYFVDSFKFMLLTSIGVFFSYLLHSICAPNHIIEYNNIIYLYITTIIVSLYFSKTREMESDLKIETLKVYSSAIAHEMKNPLSSVIMSAQAISVILARSKYRCVGSEVAINKTDFEFLNYISRSLEEMSQNTVSTVNNLLNNAKDGMYCDAKQSFKIGEAISQALKEFSSENKITVNLIDDFHFKGRLSNIKQLIINLVNNSLKHGGEEVEINISTVNNKLYFRDNGKGISDQDCTKIFETFYTKSKSGTGIGLAFCKMVIEDMGGSIECNSREGEYTEFIVSFL